MSARAVAAGVTLTFTGAGFDPGEWVTAELSRVSGMRADQARTAAGTGRPWELGKFPADSEGLVLGAAVIPAQTPSGIYDFTLTSSGSTPTFTARLTVVRPSD